MIQINIIIIRINKNFGGVCDGECSASRGQYFTTLNSSTLGFKESLKI